MSFENKYYRALVSGLDQTKADVQQLKATLDGVLDALKKRGVEIRVDFDTPVMSIQRNVQEMRKQAGAADKQQQRMDELLKITALLTSSLEFDTVLREVMDTIIRLTGAERAYLMLAAPGSDELRVQVARNWAQESLSTQDITFSQGIIQTAIESGEAVVTTNAQSDERFEAMKSVVSHSLRSIIVVPLLLKGRIIGVLYADNRIEHGVFATDDIPILNAFANQAAIAISNARLFEQVRDDLEIARQRVAELEIQIDQKQVVQEVSNITENEFFAQLSAKVAQMRAQRRDSEGS